MTEISEGLYLLGGRMPQPPVRVRHDARSLFTEKETIKQLVSESELA